MDTDNWQQKDEYPNHLPIKIELFHLCHNFFAETHYHCFGRFSAIFKFLCFECCVENSFQNFLTFFRMEWLFRLQTVCGQKFNKGIVLWKSNSSKFQTFHYKVNPNNLPLIQSFFFYQDLYLHASASKEKQIKIDFCFVSFK